MKNKMNYSSPETQPIRKNPFNLKTYVLPDCFPKYFVKVDTSKTRRGLDDYNSTLALTENTLTQEMIEGMTKRTKTYKRLRSNSKRTAEEISEKRRILQERRSARKSIRNFLK